MKKFTISALAVMGVFTICSAAFAGSAPSFSNNVNGNMAAADTVVPEKQDTAEKSPIAVALADTVVPEKKDTAEKTLPGAALTDTVVPEKTDTITPEKKDTLSPLS